MNLAAMIDLGVPESHLVNELNKLGIKEYSLIISNEIKMGISGTKVKVDIENHFNHAHGHSHEPNQDHVHRTFSVIKDIINNSSLSPEVKSTSISIFEKVAVAEGKIHGKPANEVHFHEVGAVDSIVDIVGAAICYHYLKPYKVLCSRVELGGGFVNCAHGKFPVPAPATAEILKDIPVSTGTVQFETTTPTGAAILATLVDEFSDNHNLSFSKTAYGLGHRDLEIPNVLRVHSGENDSSDEFLHESANIIECNIDDMPAEHFEIIIERLLENNAQDAWLTPIIMKKSRPATKLSVLCAQKNVRQLSEIILKETTSLGVRVTPVKKTMMHRTLKMVKTKYGSFDVKLGLKNNKAVKYKPEYDQCKAAAIKYNIPLRDIISEINNVLNQ
jgi:uncharacterized protein (TIGR00299 family) protein